MSQSSYANLDSREGIVSSEETITFNFRPKQLSIINDSPSNDLLVKLNASEAVMTIRSGEQFSGAVNHRKLIIASDDGTTTVAYRIWGIG